MKKILSYLRKQYDKLLHISVSALLMIVLAKSGINLVFLGLLVLMAGLIWERLNEVFYGVKMSYMDLLANLVGIIIGIILI